MNRSSRAEAEKLLDQEAIVRDAMSEVESNGIVLP